MQYVYHAYAVFETDDKTIELDGVAVADNPIADEQSYEALKQHIRADHGLPARCCKFLTRIDHQSYPLKVAGSIPASPSKFYNKGE